MIVSELIDGRRLAFVLGVGGAFFGAVGCGAWVGGAAEMKIEDED